MTVAFSSEIVHNNGEAGPIYQDICEFSSTKASKQRGNVNCELISELPIQLHNSIIIVLTFILPQFIINEQ